MELSEESLLALHRLADPARFGPRSFSALLRAAFLSLSGEQAADRALDCPELQPIDPGLVKQSHTAAATCILEAVRHNADRAAFSTFLEDCKFDKDRTEEFWAEYQRHRDDLEILLESLGASSPHVSDVSWRLEYQMKGNHLYKSFNPSYMLHFNVESSDSGQTDVQFHCSMEQLQQRH
uniref:COMM domain-containing protein 3 n=1 Tax=Leptobrachium leishanense TaxID=445787 RepID=A0A8C5MUZ3_9ANUR